MSLNWLIIFLGLAAILLELFIGIETGFDLVLIGIALMIGGGVGNMTDDWVIGVIVTAVLLFAYIFFGRQFVKSRLKAKSNKTNVELIIGKTGRVEKTITSAKAGQVKIGTEVWRATADKKIDEGTKVTVQSVDGVTAHVVEYT
ncbi:MAG: NfeD family protein [Candidatus Roizmanbacteria bacterium]|nr:NfeD family protein [Candidatus Roizmanbacteria bacterium]